MIILTILSFVLAIVLYILSKSVTFYKSKSDMDLDTGGINLGLRVWCAILLFIALCVPIVNIFTISFVGELFIMESSCYEYKTVILKGPKYWFKKIIVFLNSKI